EGCPSWCRGCRPPSRDLVHTPSAAIGEASPDRAAETATCECMHLRWACEHKHHRSTSGNDRRRYTRKSTEEGAPMARTRSDVISMHAWLRRKVQADLERRAREGDGVEQLRANRAIVAL